MDIYRFFHPHHNPRLHSTPLRQQEISELEQAASELRKALERAQQRTIRKPAGPIMSSHFTDIIKAMRFVENSLQTLCDAHEGDARSTLVELIQERSGFSGWEAWTSLVKEQVVLDGQYEKSPLAPSSASRDEESLLANEEPAPPGPSGGIPKANVRGRPREKGRGKMSDKAA